ncbi:MAG: hypothetical protein KAT93_05105 [Desulfuromonadales bacterium]|jgi:hypothetical protein|nr:hypothetical protein [Desulfuromonadales bacterium]
MTDAKHPFLTVRVECYAGYRGEETPRRFYFGKRCIEVATVIDRWLAPDHRYFKLRGDDGGLYILRHDTIAQRWELTLFDRSSGSGPA